MDGKEVVRLIYYIYNFCVMTLTFFVIASYSGKYYWIFDILSNFRLYYLFACIILLVIAAIFNHKIIIYLLSIMIAIQIFTVYQTYKVNSPAIKTSDTHENITLLQYNVHFLNKNYVGIVNYLIENQENLDIIFLQEVTPELKLTLKKIEKYFPYKILIDEKWFGRAFFSKLPILSYNIKFFDHSGNNLNTSLSKQSKDSFFGTNIHYLIVELKTVKHSIPITFYGIHTTSPFSQNHASRRNNELNIVARDINQNKTTSHKILAGDFNVTSSSYWFRLLEKSTNLLSAERGTGINNTWPSWIKYNLFRISIDNTLVSKNIIVKERIIGENKGSDHLPVILKLDIMPTK